MTTIKVGQRGVVTLPKKLRVALGIAEGGVLNAYEKDGALILKLGGKGDDAVLASIRAGLDEIRRGEYIEFGSIAEFEKKMRAYNED